MLLIHFFQSHWSDILIGVPLFFLITARIIPPQYAGMLKRYVNTSTNQWTDQENQSFLEAVMTALTFTLAKALTITVGLRGFATIISFGAVVLSLLLRRPIPANAVVLVALGLLALYFEQLIERAESFSLFKVITYKAKTKD
jgi:O-antigen ligase